MKEQNVINMMKSLVTESALDNEKPQWVLLTWGCSTHDLQQEWLCGHMEIWNTHWCIFLLLGCECIYKQGLINSLVFMLTTVHSLILCRVNILIYTQCVTITDNILIQITNTFDKERDWKFCILNATIAVNANASLKMKGDFISHVCICVLNLLFYQFNHLFVILMMLTQGNTKVKLSYWIFSIFWH